jgi:uncharacterized alpha-E superfamily protein
MYRKCERRITPTSVAAFLILNREFPRSIHFCLHELQRSLHSITGTSLGTWSNSAERDLGKLCGELSYLTIEEIIEMGLHEFLDSMQGKVNNIGVKIAQTFFVNEPVLPQSQFQFQN